MPKSPQPPETQFPAFQAFETLSREYARVPVCRRLPADLETPVGVFLRIARDEPYAFLLESVEGGERLGRWTFLGIRPSRVFEAHGQHASVSGPKARSWAGDPLIALGELLRERPVAPLAGLPPFTAGAVGFLAYDAVRQMERLPELAVDELHVPDAVMMFYDELIAFDHVRHEMVLVAHADTSSRSAGAAERAWQAARRSLDALQRKLGRSLPRRSPRADGQDTPRMSAPRARTTREQYLASVARAKEYIAAGDCFQVVLSQRFDVELGVDPFEVYRALRAINPSPYLYFLRMGGRCLLGSSPEMLTRVTGRQIEYRPIAGTRPRSDNPAEDSARAEEMRSDPKEVAEHIMLVDLGRNDVGRVSEYGSVRVREMMTVERYSHVMHLVSAIEGRLRPELSAMDALRACFPAGTLSGAPKVRAMQIIEELEPVRRGAYGGAVLYADGRGNLDSCIAIRSMYVENGRGYIQAGAGIVADSVPESEYQECLNKAGAVLRAIEVARSRA